MEKEKKLNYTEAYLPIEETDNMLTPQATFYEIYSQIYAKVKNGEKITDTDFVFRTGRGTIPFNEQQRVVVAIAVSDQKDGKPLRTKTNLDEEIERLLK